MPEKNANILIEKIKNGTCTEEERAIVESWYLQLKGAEPGAFSEAALAEALSSIGETLPLRPAHKKRLYMLPAAAIIVVLLTVGFYFYLRPSLEPALTAKIKTRQDAAPGKDVATITLADGSTHVLNENLDPSKFSGTEKMLIRKNAKGEIVYEMAADHSGDRAQKEAYNTIATPKGGQYQVMLPDGTHVWLNAASSIRFPLAFDGNVRRVEITGEAYFEVAKKMEEVVVNKQKIHKRLPFIVETPQQQITVLGTHFNVNSYENEGRTTTTLLEGAVNVSKRGVTHAQVYSLKPGQQSVLEEHTFHIAEADTEEAVAWKNGFISFVNADLKSIMRQVARWYNVEVQYEGQVPDRKFTGSIPRNSNLSQLLEILKYSKINFSLQDQVLLVKP